MTVIRAAWWGLTLLAAYLAWSAVDSTVSSVSLSCRKTGVYDDPPSTVRCDDSLISLVGVWPLLSITLAVVAPTVFAAVLMRPWVSWSVVVVPFVVSAVGVTHWSGLWGELLVAIPLGVVALIIALVQQFVRRAASSRTMAAAPA
ncbi:hypothetical protein [Williamsia sp.]|uniref:hypothetical protein n=1 Tax=Williamsia sp. TaxID=1872085 RepID=UPI001A352B25|nr:hypothetical protein [Williamsia sp.]MBJ7288921.1 hypothetical protein [Williamsia sp.]